MKGRKRILATVIMALVVLFSFAITAMAAEATPKEVKRIYLQVKQSSSGRITDVTPKASYADQYTVTIDSQSLEYWSGEKPIVAVTITAKDGYVFYNDFDRSSEFSISGGKFYDGRRNSNTSVYLEIECTKKAYGTLEEPTGLEWEEDYGIASWCEVDGADHYVVRINSKDITVYNTVVNLNSYLRNKHENKFRVKACSNSSYLKDSAWSEYSDELYYDKEDWDGYYDPWYDDYYNPPYNPNTSYNPGNPSYTTGSNYWVDRGGVWYYYDHNGRMVTNGMYQVAGRYYLFNSQGQMLKGRQSYNGNYYYFHENDAGGRVEGSMAINEWAYVNNKWYYYGGDGREVRNTTIGGYKIGYDGAMVTKEWQGDHYIDENGTMVRNAWKYIRRGTWDYFWYYFDNNGNAVSNTTIMINGYPYPFEANGRLKYGWFDYRGYSYYIKSDGNVARNEWIDGYYVDAYGRWIR